MSLKAGAELSAELFTNTWLIIQSSLGLPTHQRKLHKTPACLYSSLFLHFMAELFLPAKDKICLIRVEDET